MFFRMLNDTHLPLILATLFWLPWICSSWVSFQLKSTYWEGGGIIAVGQKHFPSKKNVHAHTKKDVGFLWIISCNFSLFSSYLLLRTESKKTKENYLCCEQKFCQIELHNSSSRFDEFLDAICKFAFWAQGNNAFVIYEKKSCACYKTLFCNYSGMSLYIYIVHILRHEIWLFFM